MNRILNIGSLNIDHVYRVSSFVRPGETLASTDYHRGPGGKGLNQTVAAARAGASVSHAGCVGSDGDFLLELIKSAGADVSRVCKVDEATGHAIIQVNSQGENTIVLYAGANHSVKAEQAADFLAGFGIGDWLILQNEITAIPAMILEAKARGLSVLLNPAPMSPAVHRYPLNKVDLLVCNEQEAADLSGEASMEAALRVLARRLPDCEIVLTLGGKGCLYQGRDGQFTLPAEKVKAVDTTAAGDTFVGYLAAGLVEGLKMTEALQRATKAAAITVSRAGAAESIPWLKEQL